MTKKELTERIIQVVNHRAAKGLSELCIDAGKQWAKVIANDLIDEGIEVIDRASDLDGMYAAKLAEDAERIARDKY